MVNKLSALVVDDEENARKLLNKLLEETLCFNEIRLAASVDSAKDELIQFEPDLIFLDIRMPGKDGFAFITDLPQKNIRPEIVFVTAYEQYAIKAVRNGAFDYLLKPVNRKELMQCIVRYSEKMELSQQFLYHEKPFDFQEKIPRIKVASRSGTLFINPASILYCKADGNYTTICTGEKKHLCSMNIGKVEKLLPGNRFIRLGRSLIINFESIIFLDKKESTITLVRDKESVQIKIPKQHLKDLDLV